MKSLNAVVPISEKWYRNGALVPKFIAKIRNFIAKMQESRLKL